MLGPQGGGAGLSELSRGNARDDERLSIIVRQPTKVEVVPRVGWAGDNNEKLMVVEVARPRRGSD